VDQPTVTLIAAVIAASAAILSVLSNILFLRGSEFRGAYRKSLETVMLDLSECMHAVVATSAVYLKTSSGNPGRKKWLNKLATAQTQLKVIRPRVRYSLWGLDEGLRTLSRLPDWVAHASSDPERANDILQKGKALSKLLDSSIRKSYFRGKPPSYLEKLLVRISASRLRRSFSASTP